MKFDTGHANSTLATNNPVNVDIKILNPADKSLANWYKKNDKTIVMKLGAQAELVGTAVLKDGTKSSNITWSSSDNTVATITNGKITPNKIGNTTILAVSNVDSSYKGILNVEVVDSANFSSTDTENINKVKSIDSYIATSLGNQNNIKMKKGTSVSGLSVVTLSDGTKNSNVLWESSDENVAKVDTEGKITANKVGITTIVSKYKLNPDFKALITIEVSELIESGTLTEDKNLAVLPYVQPTPIVIVEPTSTPSIPNIVPTPTSSELQPYIPANLELDKIELTETSGNGDNIPNKGESYSLAVSLKNTGGVSTNSLNLKASTTSSYATIDSYYNFSSFQKINSNEIQKGYSSYIYLDISKNTPPNTVIPLTFTIKDSFDNQYTVSGSFLVR